MYELNVSVVLLKKLNDSCLHGLHVGFHALHLLLGLLSVRFHGGNEFITDGLVSLVNEVLHLII